MNKINGFLFAICIVLIASTSSVETTVTPAVPKQVIAEQFGSKDNAERFVNERIGEGWVLKTWAVDKVHVIVMEKY